MHIQIKGESKRYSITAYWEDWAWNCRGMNILMSVTQLYSIHIHSRIKCNIFYVKDIVVVVVVVFVLQRNLY